MPGIPHFINRKTEKELNSSMQKMRPSEANPPAQVSVGGGGGTPKGNGTPKRDFVTASFKTGPQKGIPLLQVTAS